MKHIIHLQAETRTALHIGSRPDGGTDSLFRRDGRGRVVIPGSSIAGAMRSHLTRIVPAMTQLPFEQIVSPDLHDGYGLTPDEEARGYLQRQVVPDSTSNTIIDHLMGELNPQNRPIPDEENLTDEEIHYEYQRLNGYPSRLIVDNVVIALDNGQLTVVRDGVGVERSTGAAGRQSQSKFDIETLPAGLAFDITLTLEEGIDEAQNQLNRALVALALDEWQAGRIRIGGYSNRGLGVLKINAVFLESIDLAESSDHLMNLLRGSNHADVGERHTIYTASTDETGAGLQLWDWHPGRTYHSHYQPVRSSVQSWLKIEFPLHIDGFFVTNNASATVSMGFNHVSQDFIPGSSLRGVLRSQAERIARTIVNLQAGDAVEFLRRCPAADPQAMRTDDKTRVYLESLESRLRHAGEAVPRREQQNPPLAYFDLADQLFGNTFRGSRLAVADAPLAPDTIVRWKPLDFVSIDRFTGGAADKRKFDALALWNPVFDCELYLEAPEAWEIGWLIYVLRDLLDSRVPVGMGAAKGMGRAYVMPDQLVFRFGWAHDAVFPHDVKPSADEYTDGFFRTSSIVGWPDLLALAPDWAQAWLEKVNAYEVHPAVDHREETDPYWSVRHEQLTLAQLYERRISLDEL